MKAAGKNARSMDAVRAYLVRHAAILDLARRASENLGIPREVVLRQLRKLVLDGLLQASGTRSQRLYKHVFKVLLKRTYKITDKLSENLVWKRDLSPLFGDLKPNVREILHFSFTEMFNNAIDHSEGSGIRVVVYRSALATRIAIIDNGIGIFEKIRTRMKLEDERHAILELSKGKLTTDSSKHAGWGIFFTSRMVDRFTIVAGKTAFSHKAEDERDWIMERPLRRGTAVLMEMNDEVSRTKDQVFGEFRKADSLGFDKTVVPVKLAQYGTDKLVSRSQAKSVLSRVELFSIALFDFRGVDEIGQAFADEIFRVFAADHPEMTLRAIGASRNVIQMINTVKKEARLLNRASSKWQGEIRQV